MNGISIATRGYVPLAPVPVALMGYVSAAEAALVYPASVLQSMAFGGGSIIQDPTQYVNLGSVLQRIVAGVPVLSGGNSAARWLWIKLTQPLWTWLDGNVGGNSES